MHRQDGPLFPPELLSIPDSPEQLFVVGTIPPAPRVAVVGSRQADDYGIGLAKVLGRELAQAGVGVVSGGAGGVDTAALEGCLEGGGKPLAVLGTGVDVDYPSGNHALFDRLAVDGALVSEYPPGTPGRPHQFPRRNRIVSGLAVGVVVVRAALKSGSLITAHEAARQGRTVMAIPGPAGNPLSAGTHELIRHGARLVECAAEVLALLSLGAQTQRPLDLLAVPREVDPEERRLLEALGGGDCPIDVLTGKTGLGSGRVAALLLQMELKGLVVQRPGMMYRRNPKVYLSSGEEG